jgi:predicted DsbA family dithiol-disulfide isomerase
MTIEIWSDLVCPFCYIGKRRLERALSRFSGRDRVRMIRRSFELDPDAPRTVEGTLNEMLADKKGISTARAAELNGYVTAMAARDGLDYRLDRARPGNTFDAHRLVHLAAEHGLDAVVEERLMRAYFTEGQPIGDRETLVALGTECGLDADEVRSMFSGNMYADAVREDERRAAAFGIHGVPFVVIDERYAVSGAQGVEAFLDALEQAANDRGAGSGNGESVGDVCDEDGCVPAVAGSQVTASENGGSAERGGSIR